MIRKTAAAVLILAVAVATDPLAAQDPAAADEIDGWIRQLDSGKFEERKSATESLVRAGRAAVVPLRQSVRGGSLEVTTRVIYVLRELALSGDLPTEAAAMAALEDIAGARVTTSARRAQETLDSLDAIRQSRALKELVELGARVPQANNINGFMATQYLALEFSQSWKGTAADLRRLKWLTDTQELTLIGAQVTDEWLEHISVLKNLSRLVVKHAHITDAAIAKLPALDQLAALDIMYTPVTDKCVEQLSKLRGMRSLRLFGTEVSPAGADVLRTELANAVVDHRNGAFLGVLCQQPPLPCQVLRVTESSGAEQAGIEVGDIIIRYQVHEIADFNDLRERIGANRVGESVEVELVRGVDALPLSVVVHRGEAMGIEGRPHPLGVEVSAVAPMSFADRAGIRTGDYLVTIQQQRAVDVDAINRIHAATPNGDELLVELLRDVRIVTKAVTFGEWLE